VLPFQASGRGCPGGYANSPGQPRLPFVILVRSGNSDHSPARFAANGEDPSGQSPVQVPLTIFPRRHVVVVDSGISVRETTLRATGANATIAARFIIMIYRMSSAIVNHSGYCVGYCIVDIFCTGERLGEVGETGAPVGAECIFRTGRHEHPGGRAARGDGRRRDRYGARWGRARGLCYAG